MAKVETPLTDKVEVPELLVMVGAAPVMVKLPMDSPVVRSSVALLRVTLPEVLPVVPPLAMRRVPALTMVPPVWELAPERVKMPLPVLVKAPAPLMTPAKVVLVLSEPVVRVTPLLMETLPPVAPPPLRLAMLRLLAGFRITPAVLAKDTVPVPNALLLVVVIRVPATTLVPPL